MQRLLPPFVEIDKHSALCGRFPFYFCWISSTGPWVPSIHQPTVNFISHWGHLTSFILFLSNPCSATLRPAAKLINQARAPLFGCLLLLFANLFLIWVNFSAAEKKAHSLLFAVCGAKPPLADPELIYPLPFFIPRFQKGACHFKRAHLSRYGHTAPQLLSILSVEFSALIFQLYISKKKRKKKKEAWPTNTRLLADDSLFDHCQLECYDLYPFCTLCQQPDIHTPCISLTCCVLQITFSQLKPSATFPYFPYNSHLLSSPLTGNPESLVP